MEQERRNGQPRAEAARRVVERIVSNPAEPVSYDELAASTGIPAPAAMRIVRKLAIRMLVRNVGPGHWAPTPVLSRCPHVQPCA
jgi:DNA-binding IclR family transcriptional regulator